MYAVIRVAGFQYRVEPDQVLEVPRLAQEEGASHFLEEVLLVGSEGAVKVGQPFVAGAKVSYQVVRHGRGAKVVSGNYKRRKGYRRRWGFRRDFTEIRISGIES